MVQLPADGYVVNLIADENSAASDAFLASKPVQSVYVAWAISEYALFHNDQDRQPLEMDGSANACRMLQHLANLIGKAILDNRLEQDIPERWRIHLLDRLMAALRQLLPRKWTAKYPRAICGHIN